MVPESIGVRYDGQKTDKTLRARTPLRGLAFCDGLLLGLPGHAQPCRRARGMGISGGGRACAVRTPTQALVQRGIQTSPAHRGLKEGPSGTESDGMP